MSRCASITNSNPESQRVTDTDYTFKPIGIVRSCYKEKFGVPRQPGLVQVPATLQMFSEYSVADAFRGLEGFSHIWVVFVFHKTLREDWKPTVRPPRLGGNERVGVFASRSMFRPNAIGLSVVELVGMRQDGKHMLIDIRGGDFIDGTPVLDIKPYLPYVDAVRDAQGGYAVDSPAQKLAVQFTEDALRAVQAYRDRLPDLEATIRAILQYDPRPSYQAEAGNAKTEFGMRLYDFDLKWRVADGQVIVHALEAQPSA